ncbi:UNKNOWN [Stylonychia lemnae]|uniref:Uncharacterized protein n=1 Tax=Stylonychia lemnae TaxID=5949 RepID=A0A078AR42_STYLE|nr:UNKNOWN [Stylonychia lemnae]|eukprot:CDW83348.1 UNKNOWN [Stylonychia lemnae]
MLFIYQICQTQKCFDQARYPLLIGGNQDSTSFTCLDSNSEGSTVIGGYTNDNKVSQLTGTKPLVVFLRDGKIQWTMTFNILNYYQVSAIAFQESVETYIALSLQTDSLSSDPFNVMVISSSGTLYAFFISTFGIQGTVLQHGLKFDDSQYIYLAMQPVTTTKYFQMVITDFTLTNKNTNLFKKWPYSGSQANTVTIDVSQSYAYFGGIIKSQEGLFYSSIVSLAS